MISAVVFFYLESKLCGYLRKHVLSSGRSEYRDPKAGTWLVCTLNSDAQGMQMACGPPWGNEWMEVCGWSRLQLHTWCGQEMGAACPPESCTLSFA